MRGSRNTYAARSAAQLKYKLYDSYIRAIRWSSDRIGDKGLVAFVSNGGFIDDTHADGLRKQLLDEFSSVYVFNLRGNQRTSGDVSRREGGKIFGTGSRATVAIYLLIKNPGKPNPGNLYYRDIGDSLSRDEKLRVVGEAGTYRAVPWHQIEVGGAGDWINQRSQEFGTLVPLGDKKLHRGALRFLDSYSNGLLSNRDAWAYNFSRRKLAENIRTSIDAYNDCVDKGAVVVDATRLSWSYKWRMALAQGRHLEFDPSAITESSYRVLQKSWVYREPHYLEAMSLLPSMFVGEPNLGFYCVGKSSQIPFSVLMLDGPPDLHLTGAGSGGQFFPRYTYEFGAVEGDLISLLDGQAEYQRIDNVTDEILFDYRRDFGSQVTKDDIFYYLYGILHSAEYRERFGSDLRKMLPRIPKSKNFHAFSDAGRNLSELHLNYEVIKPYPLAERRSPNANDRVEKMRYAKSGRLVDRSTVIVNSGITVSGIPTEAHEYMLGSRSAVDWILERYQVRTDRHPESSMIRTTGQQIRASRATFWTFLPVQSRSAWRLSRSWARFPLLMRLLRSDRPGRQLGKLKPRRGQTAFCGGPQSPDRPSAIPSLRVNRDSRPMHRRQARSGLASYPHPKFCDW